MTLHSSSRVIPPASNQTTVPLSGVVPASSGVDAKGSHHLDKAKLIGRLVGVFRKESSVARTKLKDDDESTEGYISASDEAYYALSPVEERSDDDLVFNELCEEVHGLRRRVVANKKEMRSFERRVADSRKRRKEAIRQLNEKIAMVEEDSVLPSDTYSFFVIARFNAHSGSWCSLGLPWCHAELSFAIALIVFILQIFTLVLLTLDVIDRDDENNPLGIPAGVGWEVQASQLVALAITVVSQDEVRQSLNMMWNGYKNEGKGAINKALKDLYEGDLAKKGITSNQIETAKNEYKKRRNSLSYGKWLVSLALRFVTGIFALAVTFMLIMRADTVRDLLLNFTAVEFISSVDDAVFMLSNWGYFGLYARRDAEVVANAKPSISTVDDMRVEDPEAVGADERGTSQAAGEGDSSTTSGSAVSAGAAGKLSSAGSGRDETRCCFSRRAFILVTVWLIMFGLWAWISTRQGQGKYMAESIYVQFGDEFLPSLGTFSGLYILDSSGVKVFGGRKKYNARSTGIIRPSAKFEYSRDEKAWTFSFGDPPKLVAQSVKTHSFDILDTSSDIWFYHSKVNTARLLPLRQFSMRRHSGDCGKHGSFSNEERICVCKNNWFGLNCQFGEACESVQLSNSAQPFAGTRNWSKEYEILRRKGTNEPVRVYDHPVLVGDRNRQGFRDVMFFTGRRWVLTHTGRFTRMVGNSSASLLTDGIQDFFENEFHGHWSDYRVSFISTAVDVDSPNEDATPVGLQWFSSRGRVIKNVTGIQRLDETRRSSAVLICRCENNTASACQNDGICLGDGTCLCRDGSNGTRCEIPPTGNGLCNFYFNKEDSEFDGGDCCYSTCGGDQYTCGTDGKGNYVGFPRCVQPNQRGNGVCDLSLNTEKFSYDNGDCCPDTCNDTSSDKGNRCGIVSESVFGGPFNGYMHCRDPNEICKGAQPCIFSLVNITIVLELGAHPETLGFFFDCENNPNPEYPYGNSSPGTFDVPFQRRAGTLAVPNETTCNFVVKGDNTEGRYKVYYGESATNQNMLVEDRDLARAANKNISFSVVPPQMVPIAIRAHRDDFTQQVRLGLLCSSEIQTHDEFSLRVLDFDNSGSTFETASVRRGSTCQFDEKGKEKYELYYGGVSDDLLYEGQRSAKAMTKLFFKALPPDGMVPIIAIVELDIYSDKTQIILRCMKSYDMFQYTNKDLDPEVEVVREIFLVPNDSHCVFTILAPSDGTYKLFHGKEDAENEILAKRTQSGFCERAYFEVSPPIDAMPTTIQYQLQNMPGSVHLDLRCNDAMKSERGFPRDHITSDTTATVLVPEGTICSFEMVEDGNSANHCPRGEGFYSVYYGNDTSSIDNLIARGSQVDGETVSFVIMPPDLLSFTIALQLDDVEDDTHLNVRCDNALKIDQDLTEPVMTSEMLSVRKGSSCRLLFTDKGQNDADYFQVRYGDDSTSNGSVLFQGGDFDDSESVFFSASPQFQLVPITLLLELFEIQHGNPDDIALRLSCDDGFDVYFRISNDGRSTAHTFFVPEGAKCEVLIVDIGNSECCDENGYFKLFYGKNARHNYDIIVEGNFACRAKRNFSAVPQVPWSEVGQDLHGKDPGEGAGGASPAISDDKSTIAYGARDGPNFPGRVQVYAYDERERQWKSRGRPLYGDNPNDKLGTGLELSRDGKVIAIGARLYDDNGRNDTGQVRVYYYDADRWQKMGQFLVGENAGDEFGAFHFDLSASGTILAVGARRHDANGLQNSGHVRVFQFNSTTFSSGNWTQLGQSINGTEVNAEFGRTVALSNSGDIVAIGSSHMNNKKGQVRIFHFNETLRLWRPLGELDGEDDGDHFGISVSLSSDGKTVAIGADGHYVRVFRYDNTKWYTLGSVLYARSSHTHFGAAVSLSGNAKVLAAGAKNGTGSAHDSGYVRVWKFNEASQDWDWIGADINGTATGDRTGMGVALSHDGSILVVSDPGNDDKGDGAGRVRVFELTL